MEWIGGLITRLYLLYRPYNGLVALLPDFSCFISLTTQLVGSSYKNCDLHSGRVHYFESRLYLCEFSWYSSVSPDMTHDRVHPQTASHWSRLVAHWQNPCTAEHQHLLPLHDTWNAFISRTFNSDVSCSTPICFCIHLMLAYQLAACRHALLMTRAGGEESAVSNYRHVSDGDSPVWPELVDELLNKIVIHFTGWRHWSRFSLLEGDPNLT
jgi:hypothetical protein